MTTRPPTEPIVGIDLGTTYSLVAFCDERGPRIIPDEQGRALLPSVVRYDSASRPVVGWPAKDEQARHPLNTIFSAKRLMGRSLKDASADLSFLPYQIVEGEHNTARIAVPTGVGGRGSGVGAESVEDRRSSEGSEPSLAEPRSDSASSRAASTQRIISPQEVSAVILRHLKEQASRALGVDVKKAVITVPAYFDDAQRQATRDAARLAGLEPVRIVNEPTAAALAYGLGIDRASDRNKPATSTVVVYDLGGGTFDVSILRLTPAETDGDTAFFQVIATMGDTHLGGDDFDHAIVELLSRELGLTEQLAASPAARSRLKEATERAKRELSSREETKISLRLGDETSVPVHTYTLTRKTFESLIEPFIARSIAACERALRDAMKTLGEDAARRAAPPIDAVILVGGSTRIPLVRRRVGEFFKLEPYTALDPDQVVALGASVQASILSGTSKGSLLLDVIPLSLGLETVGGAVAKLILRNTTVPAAAAEMFSTSIDNQTSIKLHVLQGEREMAADCRSLGEFHLRGIPPMPAGIPQLQVTFLADANGVLNVSAIERRSGKRAALQIIPNHGLTREEVDRIEAESYAHAREDMTRHRIVDLIANSKLDLKWIGERFKVLADKLEPDYRSRLQARIVELTAITASAEKDWKSVSPDAFHKAKEALDHESVRLHEISIAESLKGSSA